MDSKRSSATDGTVARDAEWIIRDAAQHLYRHANLPGRLARLWWKITGRYPPPLFPLALVGNSCEVQEQRDIGVQVVALDDIRGSETRAQNYDIDFRPVREHSRQRWLRVAILNLRGAKIAPVALVRVGDVYFVRDGHYRVSVSRALGQREIRAEVTEWRVSCTSALPWNADPPEVAAGLQPGAPRPVDGRGQRSA